MPNSYKHIKIYSNLSTEMPEGIYNENEKELAAFMSMAFSIYAHSKIPFYFGE